MLAHTHTHTYTRTRIHIYTHTYIHTYTHIYTEGLHTVAKACSSLGAEVITKVLDVREEKQMNEFITALDKSRGIDIVIANAGVSAGLLDKKKEMQVKTRQLRI